MIVEVIEVGPLQVNCIILGCEATRKAVVIDPGADIELIEASLSKHRLSVELILNTHGHFDHIGANRALKASTGALLMIHKDDVELLQMARLQAATYGLNADDSPPPDKELQEGQTLSFGEESLQVLHTPGHSPGCVCFYREGLLVSGDTLFAGSVGRTDLPGGNHEQLLQSLRDKVVGLPPETKVICGHGPVTTIARELRHNPYLAS
ncbi:MBL fold metallo-hydrolase [Geopsychrobacter electrodiphilus]|uniref:MBL fold metallo-hydrolase n=1 Tax=Geopsychrobacter electrodiphilus TaxID=225196 RepID=UPI00037676A7|nr:MBL fold metallo-hydrolase [Geopsychrobacter electrodiphilus]